MISGKDISEKSVITGLLAITASAILLIAGLNSSALNSNSNQGIAQQQQQLKTNNTIRVEAGGGNSTSPLTVFVPKNIEIKAGQSINWYNPTPVGEPHSVTFMQDGRLFPPFAAPFAVPNSTEFKALIPSPNVEPLIVPNPPGTGSKTTTKTVIIDNARAYNPTVIDSTGK